MWSGVDENQTDSQTAAFVFEGSHRPFDALLVPVFSKIPEEQR